MSRQPTWLIAAVVVLVLVIVSAAAVLASPRCAGRGSAVERVYRTSGDDRRVEVAVTPTPASPLACTESLLGRQR